LISTPHLHINFKISEGIKSPWQRTTLLVSITLHNIPKDWLLEFFWWWSLASRSFYAGAVTLAGLDSNFRRNCHQCLAKNGNEQMEKFMYGQSSVGRAIAAVLGLCSFFTILPMLYDLWWVEGVQKHNRIIIRTSPRWDSLGFIVMMVLDVALGRNTKLVGLLMKRKVARFAAA
jgi:ZIP family zinc transporter